MPETEILVINYSRI